MKFLSAVVLILVVLCGPAAMTLAADETTPPPADYLLMVFLKPIEGREAEFHHWYQDEHMPEVVVRPGFVSARRYAAMNDSFLPRHDQPNPVLVAYGIRTGDIEKTFAEDSRLSQAARLADPPLYPNATRSFTYEKFGHPVSGAGPKITGAGNLKTYEFISMNGPKPGQEEAFNTWYDSRHVPDVTATPGFVGGQRYRRSDIQRYSGTDSPPYMVIYTIVTDDLRSVFADLDERHTHFVTSDSVDSTGSIIFTCEALGPLMRREEASAAMAGKSGSPSASVTAEEFESLKQKVRVLEDKEAIFGILSRYSLNVDLGRAESFLALFTDDCVFANDLAGKMTFRRGKKELGEMLAGGAPPKGQHLQLDYHVTVDGDKAVAIGYQNLTGLRDKTLSLNRAAFRYLTFRRVTGTWLIHEVYTIGIDNEAEYSKILPPDM